MSDKINKNSKYFPEDISGIAVGDYLMLPEIETKIGGEWKCSFPNDGRLRIISREKTSIAFSTFVDGNFPTALLVCELIPGALEGKKWMYIASTAADCCDDTAAVEAFDASFPPKEKAWQPSQEEFYIYRHSSVVR